MTGEGSSMKEIDIEKIKAAAQYLRYDADNYNCICNNRQKKMKIIDPSCNHCIAIDLASAFESYDPDAIRPSDSAKELATKLFDGVALRVDQFFKAKNIQGGVRGGEDMFSAIDTLELSKTIERYAQGRADTIRRECADIAEKAYRDGCSGCGEFDFTGCVYAIETGNPSVIAMAKNCDHVKALRAAIMSAGKE